MILSYTPSHLLTLLFTLAVLPSALFGQSCPAPAPITPPWLTYPALPFRHVTLTSLGARAANVYLMDTGAELGRPFVFVEGIDFGLSGPLLTFNSATLDGRHSTAALPINTR